MNLPVEMMNLNIGPGDDNYGRDKPIAWGEFPTIAKHPKHPDALRLVRHPNGPAIIHGPFLCTIGHFIRDAAEKLGPIEAGDFADWIAKELACGAQDITAPRPAPNPNCSAAERSEVGSNGLLGAGE